MPLYLKFTQLLCLFVVLSACMGEEGNELESGDRELLLTVENLTAYSFLYNRTSLPGLRRVPIL